MKIPSAGWWRSRRPGGRQAPAGKEEPKSVKTHWLPDMDSNHDKQIQSLLCYRYTIGQPRLVKNLSVWATESSGRTGVAG